MNNNDAQRFQILSLSGGGYRGLYTAKVIDMLEQRSGKPLAASFDLIAGTSIGGILGLALASGVTGEQLVKLLEKNGSKIFPSFSFKPFQFMEKLVWKCSGHKFSYSHGLMGAKYQSEPLKETIFEVVGDKTINDLSTRVLITSANWTKGLGQFFKTQHNPEYDQDGLRKLVDVAMATSAAPVYFPNYEFNNQIYVDGGLVGNAPGLYACHEAEINIPSAIEKEIHLLSIGTLSSISRADQSLTPNKGLWQWGPKLIDLMMACQEGITNNMLQQKLGNDRYIHIDEEITVDQSRNIDLDKVTEASTKTLLGMASISGQKHLANHKLREMLDHCAAAPEFFNQKC
ncbi:CBASS cGAMP-activated phospholipase [uncultured Endozoicomonas sp.]|uniref:CBASS cGAMP-activated phospholipase n=1 Tax=uncultured Endozoicomonas sp. TaxID=432652 RepID=UPI00261559A3|nr:CBASS cGAMP-activated phospholipase [uncultured Endozoicomonas sp.]